MNEYIYLVYLLINAHGCCIVFAKPATHQTLAIGCYPAETILDAGIAPFISFQLISVVEGKERARVHTSLLSNRFIESSKCSYSAVSTFIVPVQ